MPVFPRHLPDRLASESKEEYKDLHSLINRETTEELMVCSSEPVSKSVVRRSLLRLDGLGDIDEENREELVGEHDRLRFQHDTIQFLEDRHRSIYTLQTNQEILVTHHIKRDVKTKHVENVLISINPLELGIEAVKVGEFDLFDGEYLLDGETMNAGNKKLLIRRPVCLFELSKLRELVESGDGILLNDDSESPECKVWDWKGDEFHFFDEDIRLRRTRCEYIRMTEGETGEHATELRWNEKWLKDYEAAFQFGKLGAPLNRFLPSAWKSIELAIKNNLI